MRKSRQTSKTMNVEIQNDSKWVNNRVWAKEVQFDPRLGEGRRIRKGCQRRRTQYYERRQHLAPITGPAAKPRVRKRKKRPRERPCFPVISVISVFLESMNT
ncbi:hypothetical protein PEX1_018850 [Penicillium expansum]|uniref:Uncharacterized protein n=1 Tax=Penicillium expansum TaxID=27334 RepID=A0A0A2J5U4_PENEN|nr:hypothetical protein PEX2_056140 [Penicillium expansum]KGO41325.1 hypothetical protein PEXP_107050 [Penicillium expansum]KGO50136.1 hypothetical protein PEX2_056140 [Penicillium expansum]KGO60892.1 hypothetical protein PEX1_018850 [Penicillium expansum]